MLGIIGYSLDKVRRYSGPIQLNAFLFVVLLVSGAIIYYMMKREVKSKYIAMVIFAMAAMIRVAWFLAVDSIPIGDFNRSYICGYDLMINKTNYAYINTSYMARFPHMMLMSLYFGVMAKLLVNALTYIKVVNIVLSMIGLYAIYKTLQVIFKNDKVVLIVTFIAAFYAPFITYNNVFCSENLAMPFYLFSIYLFVRLVKGTLNEKYFLLAGVFLSIANMLRMVGVIILIAYILFIFVNTGQKLVYKAKCSLFLIIAFIIPLVGTSFALRASGITTYNLWKGAEPIGTSLLKGSNQDSGGRWNEEDAELFDKFGRDYDRVQKACIDIVISRYKNTPINKTAAFLFQKYCYLWREGDFSGAYWAEVGLEQAYNREQYLADMNSDGHMYVKVSDNGMFVIEIYYVILLLLTYSTLYLAKNIKKKHEDEGIYLFYYLFCGFSLLYLITESQDRYTYIVCWIFLFMAGYSIEYIMENLSFTRLTKNSTLKKVNKALEVETKNN